jgi:hypothetical protein
MLPWGFSHECLGGGIATVKGINDGALMRMTGEAEGRGVREGILRNCC